MAWPIEEIPDDDSLYMRIHKNNIGEDGQPNPGAFRDHEGGMSTNWSKYSTAEDTRNQAKNPSVNGVVKCKAGTVRSISTLHVLHTPEVNNRAHTDVVGEKTPQVRVELRRLFRWEIPLSNK